MKLPSNKRRDNIMLFFFQFSTKIIALKTQKTVSLRTKISIKMLRKFALIFMTTLTYMYNMLINVIGVASITQYTHVRNKNSNTQWSSL